MGLTRNEHRLNTKGTTDGSGGRGNWMEVVKRYKLPVISKYGGGTSSKEPANAGDRCWFQLWVVATHSRILAWRIPRTEESGRLQPIGSQRVRHN